MTNRTDPDDLLSRRLLTAAIAVLALAASAYLTQDVGAAHPLPAAVLDLDVIGEPAAPVARIGDGTDTSVPSADRIVGRSMIHGAEAPPPSF